MYKGQGKPDGGGIAAFLGLLPLHFLQRRLSRLALLSPLLAIRLGGGELGLTLLFLLLTSSLALSSLGLGLRSLERCPFLGCFLALFECFLLMVLGTLLLCLVDSASNNVTNTGDVLLVVLFTDVVLSPTDGLVVLHGIDKSLWLQGRLLCADIRGRGR